MKCSEEDIRAIDWGSPRLNDGRGDLHEMRWTRTKNDRLRDRDRGPLSHSGRHATQLRILTAEKDITFV